jgi:hypothetical protein
MRHREGRENRKTTCSCWSIELLLLFFFFVVVVVGFGVPR